jgi:indolepyruvate decarboxylase
VLNNDGYAIERLIHDGPYNEIMRWKYHRTPELFGDGCGFEVRTEGELETALAAAEKNSDKLVLIEVVVSRDDYTATLKRVGENIRGLQVEKK